MGSPAIQLVHQNAAFLADHIRQNAKRAVVVRATSAEGQHLVIAGAGPSLAETASECSLGDQVWACNGALPWLLKHGHRVTHGFTVNTSKAIRRLWTPVPRVDYLLASSCEPALGRHLRDARRSVTFFHNAVDLPEQDRLYRLYPSTIVAGSGLGAVTRAIDVADYMGFASITVIGADCAVRGDAMHVGGGRADWNPALLTGTIDGRTWTASADLWVTANWLVRMARASNGRIRIVGDTLPNALSDKPVEFLDRLPHMVFTSGPRTGERVPITV